MRVVYVKVEAEMREAIIPYYYVIVVVLAIIAENCATMAIVAINMQLYNSDSFPSSAQSPH